MTNFTPETTGRDIYLQDFTDTCRLISASQVVEELELLNQAIAKANQQNTGATDRLLIAGQLYIDGSQCDSGKEIMRQFIARTNASTEKSLNRLRAQLNNTDDW